MKDLSKLLSLILRHDAARFEVPLDPEGFAHLPDVLRAVRTRLPQTQLEDILAVVRVVDPGKQRFTVDGDEIRANYGHSLAQRIEHEVAAPPSVLFHGTHEAALAAVLASGLRPMGRQYVHLTVEAALARTIGARHGRAVVLRVDTASAAEAKVVFYRANPMFWLADFVPPAYLTRSP